jgi:hypothetical protein
LEINPRIEIRLSGVSKGNTFHSKSLIPLQPATTKKTSFVISAEKAKLMDSGNSLRFTSEYFGKSAGTGI